LGINIGGGSNRVAIRQKRLQGYVNTVWAIAASRYVEQFIIGYTYRPSVQRFAEYKVNEYEHIVVLADRLTQEEAKIVERHIQNACKSNKRNASWKKYHDYYRKLPYYPGANSPTPNKNIHSVYMVWWEPD
jgi:hypothetical protein